ncbi:MAG: glycosyltransferase family 1 protein [Chloroflexi bacterium]|nr:MAG: glycosyltransferase family 1 protein [Chloroflexota bacterium]
MRIAVDLLPVTSKPSGNRRFALQLLTHIVELSDAQNHFFFFCSRQNVSLFRERFTQANVTIMALPTLSVSPISRVLTEQLLLPLWLRKYKVDLLFAPQNVMPVLGNVPTVVAILSMHINYEQLNFPWWQRLYGRWILRWTSKKAEAFTAISQFAADSYAERYGISPKKIFVAPLGFDAHPDLKGDNTESLLDGEYILFVSALHPHKNVRFLLRAFSHIARKKSHVHLMIVGPDVNGESARLNAMADQLGIAEQVHIMGAVSDEMLVRLYSHARLFVFPSLIEGFGLPALEAMAHSLPVVVSNRTSLPEVVGDAGIVLDPTDERAWSETIIRLLEDDALSSEFAQRSKMRAGEFSWRRTAEITLECFHSVLASLSDAKEKKL